MSIKNIDDQNKVLEKIANILYNEAPDSSEVIFFRGDLDLNHRNITCYFSYTRNGVENNIALSGMGSFNILKHSIELHTLMKDHTGGEWDSFTLTLDENGQAHTKFHYPDASGQN